MTQAICADCVPLMNNESFFPEMFEPILAALPVNLRNHVSKRWFYYRSNIVDRLSNLVLSAKWCRVGLTGCYANFIGGKLG
jgi:hypothetical protein